MTQLFVSALILFSFGLALALAYGLYRVLGRAGLTGRIGSFFRWGICGVFAFIFEPIFFGTVLHAIFD